MARIVLVALRHTSVVLVRHPPDHLLAAAHTEVDVDIRHRDALRIQEALEDDVVLDRVDVGDVHAVRDEAAGGAAAAGTDGDPAALRVVDEVGDDQEVAGEAHLVDDAELVMQAIDVGLALVSFEGLVGLHSELLAQTGEGLLLHHLLEALFRRDLIVRHVIGVHVDLDITPLRDLEGRLDRVRMVVEHLQHGVPVLHIEAGAVESEALLVGDVRRGPDAEQHVVIVVIMGLEIVRVVRRHQRDAHVVLHLEQFLVDDLLVLDAVAHHFEVIAVAEESVKILREGPGLVELARGDRARDRRRQAARGADQSFVVFFEQLPVDPRLVVEALQVRLRDELHQVGVTGVIHRQKQQVVDRVVPRLLPLLALTVEARATGEVGLAADDRLHAVRAGLLVELDGPEEVAMIGLGDRRHVRRFSAFEERVVLDRAVEERVLGVEVEMNEGLRHRLALRYSHSIVAGGLLEMS